MIEFVCTSLAARIAQQGCHGYHFHIAQMSLCLGTFFFLIQGAQETICHQ